MATASGERLGNRDNKAYLTVFAEALLRATKAGLGRTYLPPPDVSHGHQEFETR